MKLSEDRNISAKTSKFHSNNNISYHRVKIAGLQLSKHSIQIMPENREFMGKTTKYVTKKEL